VSVAPTHTSLVYDEDRAYATEAGGFLREGLERGQRALVMGPPSRMALVAAELGADADAVDFVDEAVAYEPQWNVYRVLLDHLAASPGVRTRVVAEQSLARRAPAEIVDYRRLESAANLVFAGRSVDLLCPYDARTLPSRLLDIARRAHDGLRRRGSVVPNAAFRDPMEELADLAAVTQPPPDATTLDCSEQSDVSLVRRTVRAQGSRDGLDPDVVGDLELAVSEILTNALLHGTPPALVHLYEEAGMWVCHVQDGGGLPVDPLAGVVPPGDPSDHGYGLWLARQLVAAVDVGSDLTGTHVRLHVRAPGRSGLGRTQPA
jgi:anti-sigma regulatory factor (Ser/Thr protein kinase)